MTFMLSRSIFGVTDGGSFTIGEVDPNYTQILDTPKYTVYKDTSQWVTLMDSVIVNGENFGGGGLL